MLFLLFAACGQGTDSMKNLEEQNYTPPSVLTQPRFLYPTMAQENSFAGSAKLYIFINKEGKVIRVSMIKSTGYDVLDKASKEYCSTLTFKPAKQDGLPVDSHIVWEMKYNLSNQNWCSETYVKDVAKLFVDEITSNKENKKRIREEILNLHNKFAKTMNDRMNYNIIIGQVISPALSMEWEKEWDSWPLSFLLYYDFMKRYPDYDSLSKIQDQMKNSLKTDIQCIKSTNPENIKTENGKDSILLKIRTFIQKEFPDTPLKEFGLNETVELKPVS